MGVLKEEEAFALPEFSDTKRKAVVERRRRSAATQERVAARLAEASGRAKRKNPKENPSAGPIST